MDKSIVIMEKELKEFEEEKIAYFDFKHRFDKLFNFWVINRAGEYICLSSRKEMNQN